MVCGILILILKSYLSAMKLALAKHIDPELILIIKMPGIVVAAGN